MAGFQEANQAVSADGKRGKQAGREVGTREGRRENAGDIYERRAIECGGGRVEEDSAVGGPSGAVHISTVTSYINADFCCPFIGLNLTPFQTLYCVEGEAWIYSPIPREFVVGHTVLSEEADRGLCFRFGRRWVYCSNHHFFLSSMIKADARRRKKRLQAPSVGIKRLCVCVCVRMCGFCVKQVEHAMRRVVERRRLSSHKT